MSSGGIRKVTGSLLGTGASRNVKTVGFSPKRVEVHNVASGGKNKLYWQDTMADAAGIKTLANGTVSELSTLGITPLADGFTLGADTDVNVSGEKVHWAAFG